MTCHHGADEIVRRPSRGWYCRACRRAPRATYVTELRQLAHQEARALRAYLRITGRMPRCVALRMDL